MTEKTKTSFIKILYITIIFLASCLTSHAQKSEIGLFGGVSYYCGELTDNIFKGVGPAGGLVYRYNLSPRWALKADVCFGKISGSDGKTNSNYERNLSFTSPISEIGVTAELNFFKLYNATGKNRFSPYIFAGISVFSFNPQAALDTTPGATLYNLQSMGTEGQGLIRYDNEGNELEPIKKYSLTSIAIPFGIGIKVTIGQHFAFGAEWGMRYTFTDYLDDCGGLYYNNDMLREQRGDLVADLADRRTPTPEHPNLIHEDNGVGRGMSTTKDWYSFAGISFTVKFGNESRTCDLKNPRKNRHKF